ncbi:ATP-binding protein [Candidatus Eisenbacteria bacterium]|uniref:ATP-binding protein n=1 Tax=Eiseniibacteriota bacterium TaxID=2212470 RepID=A0ABV6YL07_UNCEI
MYFHRTLEDRWLEASGQFPVLLLTGPRQIGKTTLLQHLCENGRHYVSLDDPALRTLAREDPALFLQRFPPPALIDEIQYAPELLPLIKMEVDARRQPGDFWLTGSQQFQMMQGITESLAGRVAIVNLLGFSLREATRRAADLSPFLPTEACLNERAPTAMVLDLDKLYDVIWQGSMPTLIAGPVRDRDLFFSSYLQTYLQRDVRDLTQVGDQDAFVKFLKACAARTGQLLNLSELARDVDVTVPTAKSWLSVLVASMQIHLLQPYHSNVTKRLVKRPKLYFLDTGLSAYLTEWSSAETLANGAMAGPILETFVLSEILKSWWHRVATPHIYYYRDRDGREIDFVFVRDQRLHPLEVKRSATPRREWLQAFSALRRLPEETGTGGVVCLTREAIPLDEMNTAIPVGLI